MKEKNAEFSENNRLEIGCETDLAIIKREKKNVVHTFSLIKLSKVLFMNELQESSEQFLS